MKRNEDNNVFQNSSSSPKNYYQGAGALLIGFVLQHRVAPHAHSPAAPDPVAQPMNFTAAPGSGQTSPKMSPRCSSVLLQAAVQAVQQYSNTRGAVARGAAVQEVQVQQCRSAAVQEVQQCRSMGSAAVQDVGNAAVWEVQVQEVPSDWVLLRNRQVQKTNSNLKTLLLEQAAHRCSAAALQALLSQRC